MIYTDGAPTIAWADPYIGDPGDEDPSTWNDQPAKEDTVLLTKTDLAEHILSIQTRFHEELTELRHEIENSSEDELNPNDLSNLADEIRDAAETADRLSGDAYALKTTDLEDAAYEADSISRELDDLCGTLRDLASTVEGLIR